MSSKIEVGQIWQSKRNPERRMEIVEFPYAGTLVYGRLVDKYHQTLVPGMKGFRHKHPLLHYKTLIKDYRLVPNSEFVEKVKETVQRFSQTDLVLYEPRRERLGIIPDVHSPYHDELAWLTALAGFKVFKPTILITLGDFVDFYAVSTHRKDPARSQLLKDELIEANRLLDELDALGVSRKEFLGGNHEWRLDRYIADKAPALHGLVSTEKELRLKERGWNFTPYGSGINIGKLYLTHTLGKTGKYTTHKALDDAGKNVVVGHSHVLGVNYRGSAFDERHVAACFGWLARNDVASDYKHELLARREYQHGFGIGHMLEDGTVFLQAIPIINGTTVVDGMVVHG